ncbi:MAG: hypothetical protein AAF497_17065, partial [Planctomycetota bacterium]
EYKDGNYRVYNRCRDNVYVGTRVVEPNRVATWLDTDILQLDDVELVIDIDDDPTPRPIRNSVMAAYDSAGMDSPSTPVPSKQTRKSGNEKGKTPSASKSNSLLQLAVIGVCIFGSALLLMRHQMKQDSSPSIHRMAFDDVIRQAIDSPDTSPVLIQRLQFAEQARVRGNEKEARTRFANLRTDLDSQRKQFEDDQRKPELDILHLIDDRLAELSR